MYSAFRSIEASHPQPTDGRVRPLISLPTLGVGLGGYDGIRGKVIQALLQATKDFVDSSEFDVVFVVENPADYAAFQSIRQDWFPASASSRALAKTIRGGDVALLVGAGVSISAGLPTWDALLMTLKQETLPQLDDGDFATLGALDRAQLLSKSSGTKSLAQRAADATGAGVTPLPTLAHCLLASLRVRKAVTTNYDTLYEDAYRAANGPKSIAVLPREKAVSGGSWLLKMHGDVSLPDSIVLSRRDFVEYDAERRPLGSIVQSLMATEHLIVIGASMTDDNVLRLAHEVLSMNERNEQKRSLGTVVTLQDDPLRAALWEGDFNYLSASVSTDIKIAARDLEILLDGVAMFASDRFPYLLDHKYSDLLSDTENEMAADLCGVARQIAELPTLHRQRWKPLHKTLISMGIVHKPLASSDGLLLTFDDMIDAYFLAEKYQNRVDEIRDYHNLKRDILANLFGCSLNANRAGRRAADAEHDRDAIEHIARNCLRQAAALTGPFGQYLEGTPGPREDELLRQNRKAFERASDVLLQRYRKIFDGALRSLYPGVETQSFPRSILHDRGLPGTEPSELFDIF